MQAIALLENQELGPRSESESETISRLRNRTEDRSPGPRVCVISCLLGRSKYSTVRCSLFIRDISLHVEAQRNAVKMMFGRRGNTSTMSSAHRTISKRESIKNCFQAINCALQYLLFSFLRLDMEILQWHCVTDIVIIVFCSLLKFTWPTLSKTTARYAVLLETLACFGFFL